MSNRESELVGLLERSIEVLDLAVDALAEDKLPARAILTARLSDAIRDFRTAVAVSIARGWGDFVTHGNTPLPTLSARSIEALVEKVRVRLDYPEYYGELAGYREALEALDRLAQLAHDARRMGAVRAD